MVQASPRATPLKWMSLSSPIMISSISLQCPSFTWAGFSNVDVMSPPATQESHPFRSGWSHVDLEKVRRMILGQFLVRLLNSEILA